ncbi:hypothetical protein NLM33_05680 [Bradyrhizobium sp. CCGUVB1N3]|uniref:hypothetical protein n=1 Tax=Bradyrhizobium sp. CCGUVB1N3 TaxID=2949629 RepID=UPI0020B278D1|nr:hypothetical protein [Bradyrhizobium sp. CCGUVB1N3]MCP3469819.1 hypothetical protein [Bradyrhizobium sp. CCGUVB1N3]
MTGDKIPIVGLHRGVGLHDAQSPERLEVVKTAIDQVFDISDLRQLMAIAGDVRRPPEARLFAAAKLEAAFQIAADERKVRPDIDLDRVRASIAGLDSIRWRDPWHFASLLDPPRQPGDEGPVQRKIPLLKP